MGLLLVRLLFQDYEVYQLLEDNYKDYRKIIKWGSKSKVLHMDEIIERLLTKRKFLKINLPPLAKRSELEK